MSDITFGFGVEIQLGNTNQNEFLKIKETLTRMGLVGRDPSNNPSIFQTAHILHKQGRYFIMHFKEMYALDKAMYEQAKAQGMMDKIKADQLEYLENVHNNIKDEDLYMRDVILLLLEQWKLLTIADKSVMKNQNASIKNTKLKVIAHSDKKNWKLYAKYIMGKKRRSPMKKAA